MRLAAKDGIGQGERQRFRLRRFGNRVYQFLRYRPSTPKTVLLIVGCQRSGTTMMHHFFRLDRDAVTFDEYSPLSSTDPLGLRLDERECVTARVLRNRAPLVVAKPLVESQNLEELLGWFPTARALWMYRDYRDVARSNVRHFGDDNGHGDLAPILADDQDDWRAQHLAAADRSRILELYRHDLPPLDVAALFWYARNSLFFSRGYDVRDDVVLCRYDDLVSAPSRIVRAVYLHVAWPYPGDGIVGDVLPDRGRQGTLQFSPGVAELCGGLLDRLDAQPRLG